jgi:hypothetical protein
MGRKALFRLPLRLSSGPLWDFSDSLSTLDFSHLRAKGVGSSPLSAKRGDEVRTLPPKMVQVLWPPLRHFSQSASGKTLSCSWSARSLLRVGEQSAQPCGRWAWTNTRRSTVTIGCSEKRSLVEPTSEPHLVGIASRGVRRGRSTHPRHRRDPGATLRQEVRSQGPLP